VRLALVWVPVLLLLALPFGWENTLAGFQSGFYGCLAFSLAALWLLSVKEPWSAWWAVGVAAVFAALFTVASGVGASAAVFAVNSVLALKDYGGKRTATALAAGGAMVLGLAMAVDVPENHRMQAQSVGEFTESLGACLAWPWVVLPVFALANLAPLAAVAAKWWRKPTPLGTFAVALGLWTCLQACAVAFMRGCGGAIPGWRYMDALGIIVLADGVAFAVISRPETVTTEPNM